MRRPCWSGKLGQTLLGYSRLRLGPSIGIENRAASHNKFNQIINETEEKLTKGLRNLEICNVPTNDFYHANSKFTVV